MRIIRYLSHPQVMIDPEVEVTQWGLNDVGHARVADLVASGALEGTWTVISSAEVKALETARPLAKALGCELKVRPQMRRRGLCRRCVPV